MFIDAYLRLLPLQATLRTAINTLWNWDSHLYKLPTVLLLLFRNTVVVQVWAWNIGPVRAYWKQSLPTNHVSSSLCLSLTVLCCGWYFGRGALR